MTHVYITRRASLNLSHNLGPAALAGLAAAPLPTQLLLPGMFFFRFEAPFSLVTLKAAKSGVPIVLMMFLYEARAPCTGTS